MQWNDVRDAWRRVPGRGRVRWREAMAYGGERFDGMKDLLLGRGRTDVGLVPARINSTRILAHRETCWGEVGAD